MRIVLNSNDDYSNRFKVIPEKMMNTMWYNNNPAIVIDLYGPTWNSAKNIYSNGDFIIHLAGNDHNERFRLMQMFDGRIDKISKTPDISIHSKMEFGDALNDLKLYGNAVEIGVLRGEFSKELLSKWKGNLYMIDTWRKMDDYIDGNSRDDSYHLDCMMKSIENTKPYEDRAHILRMRSEEAAKMFPDNYFDYIYIDANHDYNFVKKDLDIWYPKLRVGGLFSGDDYLPEEGNADVWMTDLQGNVIEYAGKFGVKQAVDEFAKSKGYVVKNTTLEPYWRQWFFIKDKN